jgi:hypothetical protein
MTLSLESQYKSVANSSIHLPGRTACAFRGSTPFTRPAGQGSEGPDPGHRFCAAPDDRESDRCSQSGLSVARHACGGADGDALAPGHAGASLRSPRCHPVPYRTHAADTAVVVRKSPTPTACQLRRCGGKDSIRRNANRAGTIVTLFCVERRRSCSRASSARMDCRFTCRRRPGGSSRQQACRFRTGAPGKSPWQDSSCNECPVSDLAALTSPAG